MPVPRSLRYLRNCPSSTIKAIVLVRLVVMVKPLNYKLIYLPRYYLTNYE